MRKIYLLLLFISGIASGQVTLSGNAHYDFNAFNGYVDFSGSDCGSNIHGGLQWIVAEYANPIHAIPYMPPATIVQGNTAYPGTGDGLARTSWPSKPLTFTEDNKIIDLKIRTTYRDTDFWGSCNSSSNTDATIPLSTNYNQVLNFADFSLNQPGYISVTVTPTINLVNTDTSNDIIGTKDYVVIPSIYGVANNYYKWEYHVDGDQYYVPPSWLPGHYVDRWVSLSAVYQQQNSLNIACKDFLPPTAVGKTFSLRAINTSGSSIINLQYRYSAPVVESVITTATSCFDTNDGSATFLFDDTLLPGEQLNYTLIDIVTGTPTSYNGAISIAADKTFVLSGLKKGSYQLQLTGFNDGSNTSVDLSLKEFDIGSPLPVDFSLANTNIQCNGGHDGTISVTAWGGTRQGYQYSIGNENNWVSFDNPINNIQTIGGLSPGIYDLKIKDNNNCVAKNQTLVEGVITLGTEKSLSTTITQPAAPVSVAYTLVNEPLFNGGANGMIVAAVRGGTQNDDNSYSFEWKNINGDLLQQASGVYNSDGAYNITLGSTPAGDYKLTAYDKNYNLATDKSGCTVTDSFQHLGQPDPINIVLNITKPISCNTANDSTTGNSLKLEDGQITATVTGGVPPYTYNWQKDLVDLSVSSFSNPTIATGLSAGTYSLNVTDKNGVVQGTYDTVKLINAAPTNLAFSEPAALVLGISPTPVSCYEGNDGSAITNVSGGTANYKWDQESAFSSNTKIKTNLTTGICTFEVKDGNGCATRGSIEITEPASHAEVNYVTVNNPTFSGATNGKIEVEVTGGTPLSGNSYRYEWRDSKGNLETANTIYDGVRKVYTISLNNVPADNYFLTVWDENADVSPNPTVICSTLESKQLLTEPKPLKATLEIKRTISCNTKNPFGKEEDSSPADGQRDESQDGILVAHVTGGTTLLASQNNGLPYFYTWKKQQSDNSWTEMITIKDSVAISLSHGNYALNVIDRNGIVLGEYDLNNELVTAKDSIQFMQEPPIFAVSLAKRDVFCKGGNDGWAKATVTGGTLPYLYNWSNGETLADNETLTAGLYSLTNTDDKGCLAKADVTIMEPEESPSLKYTEITNPSFYKATNGRLIVEVKGGTSFSDKSYSYEWKNSAGVIQAASSALNAEGVYTITLDGIPEDTYTLTIRDANYDLADNKNGCTIIDSTQSLDDPDPLVVSFEVQRTISCNVLNEFGNETDSSPADGQRDESQDGILVAHVTGGIQLSADQNNGLPYYYTWKKQLADKSWVLWNDSDETAEHLSNGIYALNIEDKNGIKLGTYVNNILVTETDATQAMPEPDQLVVSFDKFDVGCTVGNDGWAQANINGGTLPYNYQWTNGGETAKIENLTTNNYFTRITDAKGCQVQGSIFVGDPNGIIATESVTNPTCFEGNDGTVTLDVSGGNEPFTYEWNTGETSKDISQLKAGNYGVTINCPACCVYKKYFTLKDPDPIVVNLGVDRTLCNGQSLTLNASLPDANATYSWTSDNGFTSNSPQVNLTEAGIYEVKATSDLGCVGQDSIVVQTNDVNVDSEFFLSSQAYLDEDVILINASDPPGETTQWLIPEGVQTVNQDEKSITLKFTKTGGYSISLKQTQGDCYALSSKNINVEPRSTLPTSEAVSVRFIDDFTVSPNPNNGSFKTAVKLEDIGDINLRLFSYNGIYTLIEKKDTGKKDYEVDFNVQLASGIYVLVLETGEQTMVKKVIIY